MSDEKADERRVMFFTLFQNITKSSSTAPFQAWVCLLLPFQATAKSSDVIFKLIKMTIVLRLECLTFPFCFWCFTFIYFSLCCPGSSNRRRYAVLTAD